MNGTARAASRVLSGRSVFQLHSCQNNKLKRLCIHENLNNKQTHAAVSCLRSFATSKVNTVTDENANQAVRHKPSSFAQIVDATPTQFGFGKIAKLTESSIIGTSGQTVVLATVASAPAHEDGPKELDVGEFLRQRCRQVSSFVPLTVDYRQRHHAVGKIPSNANRSDNQRPTSAETLASRVIDRSLRPLLLPTGDSIHISCSIQACSLQDGLGGYPAALALNAAAVAVRSRLKESVACVYLSLLKDGTVIVNPSTKDDSAAGELLYAGTREQVVMMEFSGMLEESKLEELIKLAHECVQPLLDVQDETTQLVVREKTKEVDDAMLFKELGLPLLKETPTEGSEKQQSAAEEIYAEAFDFCASSLRDPSLKLFGYNGKSISKPKPSRISKPLIHSASNALLTKAHRGRRENIFQKSVASLVETYFDQSENKTKDLKINQSLVEDLASAIHSDFLKESFADATITYKSRADNRGLGTPYGCNTIRPISLEVPALPDTVHGSALFTRGETQVLCTATLGPPGDGIALKDPFAKAVEESSVPSSLSDTLPVGSLRYLKTQEYLESDLNSRKVRADREQTGDSGTLKERQRAFLQYDFPAFGKGEVQSGPRGINRREIGHGALAEKAILPILPSTADFPYTIRLTSEVTGSNGSSSMASVCGATLALLDAGVPISAPVAGLSIGLAKRRGANKETQLLVDITGTEDHYGVMDAKIAGTYDSVTAIHMDVHEPLDHAIIFEALQLAKNSRKVLLDEMKTQATVSSKSLINDLNPRPDLKPTAPRVEVVRFDPMRKKDLLGPGGAVIRQMEDRFNVSLDLAQEGQCLLFGEDKEMVRKAKVAVMDLVKDVQVGEVYEGTVIEIRDFGMIVELLRNKEGLCHVSEMADRKDIMDHPEGPMGLINAIVKVGDTIDVECISVDQVMGTIRLRPIKRSKK